MKCAYCNQVVLVDYYEGRPEMGKYKFMPSYWLQLEEEIYFCDAYCSNKWHLKERK